MLDIKPYIIVPNLIEQPTWGGDYISTLKDIQDPAVSKLIIGQSYELYEHSNISLLNSTRYHPSLELSDPSDPTLTQPTTRGDSLVNINNLINLDPAKVLGTKAVSKGGTHITTLIKLTQARGNSFQLHRKPSDKSDYWLPKAESWYYLEPGLATLGIKKNVDWSQYRHVCKQVEQESVRISKQVQQQDITFDEATKHLQKFISKHNPMNFVNLVTVGKNQGIDLSRGGIHHSWEENNLTHPLGNVLYEVQQNVYDPDCTIRSFDKGKLKPDGSARTVHIDDYFAFIDRDARVNDPATHFTVAKIIKKTSTQTIKRIFATPYYHLDQLTFSAPVKNKSTTTSDSYHHLFVRRGNLKLITSSGEWEITRGYSVFIPAQTGTYLLKPYKCKSVQVLKTFI